LKQDNQLFFPLLPFRSRIKRTKLLKRSEFRFSAGKKLKDSTDYPRTFKMKCQTAIERKAVILNLIKTVYHRLN